MITDVMTIGMAARLVGRAPDTLRWWERLGLISPRRLSNGMRVFSRDDIEQLKQVAALRTAGRPRRRGHDFS
jgi:MerR family transcriptional regulator/heat shock protein HspR